ncbi:MAG: GNAT family N-acetyltransferase [Nitrososphaeria archaeon]
MLKVTEVDNINKIIELKNVWNKLLSYYKNNNPFLTFEYLATYWKHFGKDRKLKILCVKDEKNEIVAIAPLRLSNYTFAGLLTYKVIEPLSYMGADYTDFILPNQDEKCLRKIISYLYEKNDWDFIYLYDIPETSTLSNLLRTLNNRTDPFIFDTLRGTVCPYISLPNSMEAFTNRLNPNFRKNLKKRLKKLEKDFRKIELKSYRDFGTVEEAMNIFFKLHQKRWTTKDMPGVFSTTETKRFYVEVAKRFAEKGWLALYFLTVNDEPIAARYGFEYNNKMYFCLHGFNPDYSRYAPGHIMHLKVIENCIKKGIIECDFLKGGEPYKFYWTNTYRTNMGFRFVNKKKITSKIYDLGIKTAKKTKIDQVIGKLLQF